MNLMWSVTAFATLATGGAWVVERWEEVGFGLTHTLRSSPLVISNKETGCTISEVTTALTCQDSTGSQPSNAFQSVVNCRNMDPITTVVIKGSDSCGKLTFTQHFAEKDAVNTGSGSVQIQPGQLVNLTCVLLPFPDGNSAKQKPWADNFARASDVKLDFAVRSYDNETKRLQGGTSSVSIGTVKFSQDLDKVNSESCSKAVDALFDWKLSLTESSQNVHQLLWSSQPKAPSAYTTQMIDLKELPMQFTSSMRDLGFYDLRPSISRAVCGTSLMIQNYEEKVKLQVEQLAKDVKVPEKHEEVVKITVDATQLPTSCREIKVEVEYTIPNQSPRYVDFLLPVENPNVPDTPVEPDQPEEPKEPENGKDSDQPKDQPEKKKTTSSGLGTAFWIILIFGLLSLGVGAFLYRRHLLIQAARALP